MSKKKPLVCYLFTKYDKVKSYLAFIKNYKNLNLVINTIY